MTDLQADDAFVVGVDFHFGFADKFHACKKLYLIEANAAG